MESQFGTCVRDGVVFPGQAGMAGCAPAGSLYVSKYGVPHVGYTTCRLPSQLAEPRLINPQTTDGQSKRIRTKPIRATPAPRVRLTFFQLDMSTVGLHSHQTTSLRRVRSAILRLQRCMKHVGNPSRVVERKGLSCLGLSEKASSDLWNPPTRSERQSP